MPDSLVQTVDVDSEAGTAEVAAALASSLERGAVVLLVGDLGAGKTAFVRGMAPALGIDPDEISSPTFALVQPYRGARTALYHVDLYRLEGAAVDDLGLEELAADGVLVVEWAERWARPLPAAIRVAIADLGGERRRIRIERPAPAGRQASDR